MARKLTKTINYLEAKLPSKNISWTLSVGQFLDAINIILKDEKTFVVGEVVEYKSFGQWTSFSLKDKEDGSVLPCFLASWAYRQAGILLEDGMEVKVGGAARVYKPRGSFSFQVETIEPLGEGSLKKAYELLLKKLEAEGLFTRKRVIPNFIQNIGVISSRDGIVIHDLLKNLKLLNYKIDFINARVEGLDAVPQLVNAIKWFNNNLPAGRQDRPALDAIVIIRGGGSLESLQAFNNELLAREIFASKIPVIVGIGHEVNAPIACMVADYSASTPTAVATFINRSWDPIVMGVPAFESRILRGFENRLATLRSESRFLMEKMIVHLKNIFQSFKMLSERITVDALEAIKNSINSKLEFIKKTERILTIASPLRNLKLGYSIITGSGGRVIKDTSQLKKGEKIKSKLAKGEVLSIVEGLNK